MNSAFRRKTDCSRLIPLVMGAAFAVLGACGAQAQESSPVKSLLGSMNFTTDVPESKDFVRSTRKPRESLDYIPTVAAHPERKARVKTPEEVARDEASLDSARQNHDRLSSRKPGVVPKAKPKVRHAGPKPVKVPRSTFQNQ